MKKYLLGFVALFAIIVAGSAFVTKEGKKEVQDYYWYQVDLSTNTIPQFATPLAHAPDVEATCEEGETMDCLRGFINQPNTSSGPVSARGDIQKMTDEEAR